MSLLATELPVLASLLAALTMLGAVLLTSLLTVLTLLARPLSMGPAVLSLRGPLALLFLSCPVLLTVLSLLIRSLLTAELRLLGALLAVLARTLLATL